MADIKDDIAEVLGYPHSHVEKEILEAVRSLKRDLAYFREDIDHRLRRIERLLHPPTPTLISFQEITMLPPDAGNTLVYTGTLAPTGAAFSAGTTFAVTSSDTTVSPSVDPTGLIVTIPLPTGFVDDPANPLTITYVASGITPEPATSPTSITATITPTIPTPTPTGIQFLQTT